MGSFGGKVGKKRVLEAARELGRLDRAGVKSGVVSY
jgi:hypothetical protein